MHHIDIDMDFLLIIATTDAQSTVAGRDDVVLQLLMGRLSVLMYVSLSFWDVDVDCGDLGYGFWA